eukprot:4121955-Prymnesium_polylepis.2
MSSTLRDTVGFGVANGAGVITGRGVILTAFEGEVQVFFGSYILYDGADLFDVIRRTLFGGPGQRYDELQRFTGFTFRWEYSKAYA